MFSSWKPYVPMAERRKRAARAMARLKQAGHAVTPVVIEGRAIARTVWGSAWCKNLESYSDYANRLPRGRTYVRNGSVVHLEVHEGRVEARVSGSAMYLVRVNVAAMPRGRWEALCGECTGGIDSLVELLQGRVSKHVLDLMCRPQSGLFPKPSELKFECSCPDWAEMCKHVAAALYGIGARLDEQPELLFRLRTVDERDLIARAGRGTGLTKPPAGSGRLLDERLAARLFGIELAESEARERPAPAIARRATKGRVAKPTSRARKR